MSNCNYTVTGNAANETTLFWLQKQFLYQQCRETDHFYLFNSLGAYLGLFILIFELLLHILYNSLTRPSTIIATELRLFSQLSVQV